MIALGLILALTVFALLANESAGDGGNVGGGGAMLLLLLLGLPWSFFILLAQGDSAATWYPVGLGIAAMLNVTLLWTMASARATDRSRWS